MYDSPYALLEAVLFIEGHPELSFEVRPTENRLIARPTAAARSVAGRIRKLKGLLMMILGEEWTHARAEKLLGQMHKYVIHVVLAKGMVQTIEYVDGGLGEDDPPLRRKQRALEGAIDAAAAEEDWAELREQVARYVAFWRRVHKERLAQERLSERIESEQEEPVTA